MKQWKLLLTSDGEDLGKVDVKRERDISSRQFFTIVVCFEYGTFVVDT